MTLIEFKSKKTNDILRSMIDYMNFEDEDDDNFHKVEVTFTEEGIQSATLYIKYAKKAVITILEEYKGAKFDKTCISEIFVTGSY